MDAQTMIVIGGAVGGVTPPLMGFIKGRFPDWEKKAWFPLVFGALASLGAALASGQVLTLKQGVIAFLIGLGAGGTASSVRDVSVGK